MRLVAFRTPLRTRNEVQPLEQWVDFGARFLVSGNTPREQGLSYASAVVSNVTMVAAEQVSLTKMLESGSLSFRAVRSHPVKNEAFA
jgi:hypothetical protein